MRFVGVRISILITRNSSPTLRRRNRCPTPSSRQPPKRPVKNKPSPRRLRQKKKRPTVTRLQTKETKRGTRERCQCSVWDEYIANKMMNASCHNYFTKCLSLAGLPSIACRNGRACSYRAAQDRFEVSSVFLPPSPRAPERAEVNL